MSQENVQNSSSPSNGLSINNPLVAVPLSVIGLVAIYVYSENDWFYVFSIILTWLIIDLLFSLLIAGGNNIFQWRPSGSHTIHKGKAYLAFLMTIIFATLVAEWLTAKSLTPLTNPDNSTILLTLGSYIITTQNVAANSLIGILVYADLNARFY